jgi:hypothetical protein
MMLRLRFRRRAAAVTHVCRQCEARRALFRYRGVVKWDRYHTLCVQCCRKHLNRLRAARLAAGVPASPDPLPQDRAAVA